MGWITSDRRHRCRRVITKWACMHAQFFTPRESSRTGRACTPSSSRLDGVDGGSRGARQDLWRGGGLACSDRHANLAVFGWLPAQKSSDARPGRDDFTVWPEEGEEWDEKEEGVHEGEDDGESHQVGHFGEEGELARVHQPRAAECCVATRNHRGAHDGDRIEHLAFPTAARRLNVGDAEVHRVVDGEANDDCTCDALASTKHVAKERLGDAE
mmetsp:Transcript_69160/g.154270  ORF Transcript_69160/g.154270 Transcript_69160/m.154270 type:complete len:213 (-) Transcript_69160:212-850(-)